MVIRSNIRKRFEVPLKKSGPISSIVQCTCLFPVDEAVISTVIYSAKLQMKYLVSPPDPCYYSQISVACNLPADWPREMILVSNCRSAFTLSNGDSCNTLEDSQVAVAMI